MGCVTSGVPGHPAHYRGVWGQRLRGKHPSSRRKSRLGVTRRLGSMRHVCGALVCTRPPLLQVGAGPARCSPSFPRLPLTWKTSRSS